MSIESFDFTTASVRDIYALLISAIVPRPIAWVTTLNKQDGVNLAPFSFFNGVSSRPPCLVFAVSRKRDGSKKDTLLNIEHHREFVTHLATEDQATAVNETSAELAYGESEVTRAGLTTAPSTQIKTPRIIEAPIAIECKLQQTLDIGGAHAGAATLVIGEMLILHASAEIFSNGQIDPEKFKPLSRLGGTLFGKTREIFSIPRPKV